MCNLNDALPSLDSTEEVLSNETNEEPKINKEPQINDKDIEELDLKFSKNTISDTNNFEEKLSILRPLNISNRHIFKKLNPENGLNKVVI